MKAIEAKGLTKTYESRIGPFSQKRLIRALDGLDMEASYGSITGLLGPNGAGKTTTVKILATLLTPDSGEARVAGFDVLTEPDQVRRRMGVVLDATRGFFLRLTGRENLVYFGMLHDMSREEAGRRADRLLEQLGLRDAGGRQVEGYSTGMKARLSICRALMHEPEVLIFDEPTAGLDPISAKEVRDLLRGLRREGVCILLTTHNLWEAEALCDRIVVINRGRVVAAGSSEQLKATYGLKRVVEVEVFDGPARIEGAEVGVGERGNRVFRFITEQEPGEYIPILMERLRGLKIGYVKVREPSLEDVFIRAVGERSEL